MRESEIENYLRKRCNELGFLCEKFTSPGSRSKPDDLITAPYGGLMVLIELKAPGKEPTDAQKRDHMRRRDRGVSAVWTDSIEGVEMVLQLMLSRVLPRDYKY